MAKPPAGLKVPLQGVDDGDVRYVSALMVDSVHTVRFEMHEDILIVLGKERSEQAARSGASRCPRLDLGWDALVHLV